jgi:hypothetical protein
MNTQHRGYRILGDQHQQQIHAFNVARAQARYRSESWNLTLAEFLELWADHWHQRGRRPGEYCMTRITTDLGWSPLNVQVQTRGQQLDRQQYYREAALQRRQNASS